MKKCTFIIPYFGKFPNYFPLFLKSCGLNKNYSWIIITDNHDTHSYPDNVKVLCMSFENFKEKLERKLGFKINIQDYHKICDFKPTYGYVFEDELVDSLFWGYCDIDLIFGNFDSFLTDDILEKYDKVFCLGHLTMYRNTPGINREFMRPLNGDFLYKKALSSSKTYVFDEPVGEGVNRNIDSIFNYYGNKIFTKDYSLNVKVAPANIIRVVYDYKNKKFIDINLKNSLCIWNNGNLETVKKINGKLVRNEYLYAHFQSRSMRFDDSLLNNNKIKILGNGFYNLEYDRITLGNFSKIKKNIVSLRYIRTLFRWKFNALKNRLIIQRG